MSLSPPDLVTALFFGTCNFFFLILNRFAMWVFDTRMYTVSHMRLYEAAIAYSYPGSLKACTLLCSYSVTNCKKSLNTNTQLVCWNGHTQSTRVCMWVVDSICVRWDQIHMTMWNEADISRGLLDFMVSIQSPFIYLFIIIMAQTKRIHGRPKQRRNVGAANPRPVFIL